MRHLICLLAAALLQASLFSATGAAAQVSPHAELQPTFGQTAGNGRPRLDVAGGAPPPCRRPPAGGPRGGLLGAPPPGGGGGNGGGRPPRPGGRPPRRPHLP